MFRRYFRHPSARLRLALASALALAAVLTATPAFAQITTVRAVRVEPQQLTLAPNETHSYRAWVEYSDGTSEEITSFAEWTTETSKHARVSNERGSRGLVTARAPGTVEIRAAFIYGTRKTKGSAVLTVDAGPAVRLRTKPTTKSLEVGDLVPFEARLVFENGYEMDITERAIWTSSDTRTATVAATGENAGLVRAVRVGNATITARDPITGLRSSDGATVVRAGVTHIGFDREAYLLGRGMRFPARVYAYRTDGTRTNITDDVKFEGDVGGVIAIVTGGENAGMIYGIGEGTMHLDAVDPERGLRAKFGDGRASVRVAGRLESILVDPISVGEGEARNARAWGQLSNGELTDDLRKIVTWTTADSRIATVGNDNNDRGAVTGVSAGSTTLVARDPHTGIRSSGTENLLVRGPFSSLTIEPASLVLGRGMQYPIRAYGNRADGSRSNLTNAVEWTSSDPSVVTIEEGGWLVAHKAGSVELSARDAEKSLETLPAGRSRIRIGGAPTELRVSPLRLDIGVSRKAKVYARLPDGSDTSDLRPAVVFSIEDASIARLGGDGIPGLDTGELEGLVAGWTTLTAFDPASGLRSSGTRNLKVQGEITGLVIEAPDNGRVPVGASSTFKARAVYEDGETSNVSDKCEWSSDNPDVAEVDNELPDKGDVTGLTFGETTTIRAICHEREAEIEVVIIGNAIGLRLVPNGGTFSAFRSKKFRAWAEHEGGEELDLTGDSVWLSTNPHVAIPDAEENGRIHFLDSGETDIVAVAPNGFFAAATIRVEGGIRSIEITPRKATIRGGSGRRLRVTATLDNGKTRRTVTRSVTLSSSDPDIVRIAPTESEPGRVLADSKTGTAIITARTGRGVEATTRIRVRDVLESLEILLHRTDIESGEDGRYKVIGRYSNGQRRHLTRYVKLRSSDEDVARAREGRRGYGRIETREEGEVSLVAVDGASGIESPPVYLRVHRLE